MKTSRLLLMKDFLIDEITAKTTSSQLKKTQINTQAK
jgi:hypothetical protein